MICPACGAVSGAVERELCQYHVLNMDEGWAQVNRIMCGFFHRKQEPPRLSLRDRLEEGEPCA